MLAGSNESCQFLKHASGTFFEPPTSKKLVEHIAFGFFICPFITLSKLAYGQEQLGDIRSWKFYI